MTTKIITHDLPADENSLAKELGTYIDDGYFILSIKHIPEIDSGLVTYRAHLLIILHKYTTTAISGPNIFNFHEDV